MYVCLTMYACVYACMYVYKCIYVYTLCMCTGVYMYICIFGYVWIIMYICLCLCICVFDRVLQHFGLILWSEPVIGDPDLIRIRVCHGPNTLAIRKSIQEMIQRFLLVRADCTYKIHKERRQMLVFWKHILKKRQVTKSFCKNISDLRS